MHFQNSSRTGTCTHALTTSTTNHFLLVKGFMGKTPPVLGSRAHLGYTLELLVVVMILTMRAYRETYQRCKPVKLGITLAFPVRSNNQTIGNSPPPTHRSDISTPRFGLAPSLPLHQSVSSSGVPCLWLTNLFPRNPLVGYFIAT